MYGVPGTAAHGRKVGGMLANPGGKRLAWFLALAGAVAAAAGCGPRSGIVPAGALPGLWRSIVPDATLVIRNQHHRVYRGLAIATRHGDCVRIENSTGISIEASQIGPCGGVGVSISGGGDIKVLDSYIHPETKSRGCCDRNDGIFVTGATGVTIAGNVLAYGESNVEASGGATKLAVVGNFLLNPRGPFPRGQNVQAWQASNVLVRDNYTLSSTDTKRYKYPDDQEDSINFGIGSAFEAADNYITGGHSPTGCGLIADDGANAAHFHGNRLVNSGECGIGVASGTDQIVEGNRIINQTPVKGGGNTALYVWKQYRHRPCGPVSVTGNIATEVRRNGEQSGYWDGGGCGPVTLKGNVWDEAARKLLTPPGKKLPPPLIPPRPSRCAIESPYTTQTKWPAC